MVWFRIFHVIVAGLQTFAILVTRQTSDDTKSGKNENTFPLSISPGVRNGVGTVDGYQYEHATSRTLPRHS